MLPCSPRLASLTILALTCPACVDDDAPSDSSADDGDRDHRTAASRAPRSADHPTPVTTGDGTTTDVRRRVGPSPSCRRPVRGGLEIDWVEADQGVGVAIGRDGAGVGGAERTSYLIQNRLTLVRAFWKPLPGRLGPARDRGPPDRSPTPTAPRSWCSSRSR